MGKYYKHWQGQLEFAEEAGDEIYIQHCQKMMESYIDEEDLEEDEDDDYEDFLMNGDITIEFETDSVGQWEVGNGVVKMILPLDQKPSRLQQYFTKKLLGWKWVDKQ